MTEQDPEAQKVVLLVTSLAEILVLLSLILRLQLLIRLVPAMLFPRFFFSVSPRNGL